MRRWEQQNEELTDEGVDIATVERLRSSKIYFYYCYLLFYSDLQELDRHLGPYPYESLKRWLSLTNNITTKLVERFV